MVSLLDLFETTRDGICAVNRDQRIVRWNRSAEGLLGYGSSEVVGRRCYEVLRGRDEHGRPVCRHECVMCARAARREAVPTTEVRVTTKSGAQLWLSVTTILIPPPWRDEAILVHLLRDATRGKMVQAAVDQLVAEVTGRSSAPERSTNAPCARVGSLTGRQRDVLRLLAASESTQAIADALGVSPSTVRNHVHSILVKLEAHSRLEAVMIGVRSGLL